jgi:hypothetical protein
MSDTIFNELPAQASDPAYGVASQVFAADYIKALYDHVGAWQHTRNETAEVTAYGQKVTLASMPRLTVVSIDPTTSALTGNTQQITAAVVTVDQYKGVPFKLDWATQVQSRVDLPAAFSVNAADAISSNMDLRLAVLAQSLTTNSVGSLGSNLTEAVLDTAIGKLVQNHVPLENPEDLVWVLPGSQWSTVKQLTASYATNYRIIKGMDGDGNEKDIQLRVETLHSIPIFWKTDTSMAVSGGQVGGLFYRDCVGTAIQRNPALKGPFPMTGYAADQIVAWSLYGMNIIKDPVGCQILTV